MKARTIFINLILGVFLFTSYDYIHAQKKSEQLVSNQYADTWSATDDLGREVALNKTTGDIGKGKYVGIFYFLWLGAHGHDSITQTLPDEGVYPKRNSDTLSPYDISKILKENPENPQYGPVKAFHHWGEPYFGYYLSNDEWVMMKHAQLLSDAGIDVIVFDVTNSSIYLPQVFTICKVFSKLQEKGWAVPKIAFLTNSNHVETTKRIYKGIYEKGLYKDLWFYWKGKPLLMGNPEGLPQDVKNAFSMRRSWAWTEGQEWFGDGKDKWPWIDHYPQNYGWHEDPSKPEQIAVASAQHPISNIGRSFHDGKQPPADSIQSGKGLFFAEQWERALEVDPEFVFITGWNEWVAMRFNDGKAKTMMGLPVKKGETYFVDQYNAEFSRDIEPMKGGFKDNYYYQMVDNIRKYKGTRKLTPDTDFHQILINGDFKDWEKVGNIYYDHTGDTQHRQHPGWGGIKEYVNVSGRNDIVEARATEDENYFYFYLKLVENFESASWPENLSLLLKNESKSQPSWEGYNYLISKKDKTEEVIIQKSQGGWKWQLAERVEFNISENQLEVAIPKELIKSEYGYLEFKWLDNVDPQGDIMSFYDQGDVAPNSRFNYRYKKVQ